MIKELAKKKMIEALKSGNKVDKNIYSMVLQTIQKAEKDKRVENLAEEDELAVISKYAKQVKESIEACPNDRVETIDSLKHEYNLVSEFLPKQMTEDEIRDTICSVLTNLGILDTASNKDKGRIMKELMPKVKGKADGKLVNTILSTYLNH